MKKTRKYFLKIVLVLTSLCLLAAGALILSNMVLPQQSETVETLSQADKIRLAETQHLRQSLGDLVWPGWGQADIPAIAYNEEAKSHTINACKIKSKKIIILAT
jgi:hypothetical protein